MSIILCLAACIPIATSSPCTSEIQIPYFCFFVQGTNRDRDGFTISKAAGEIEGTHDELLNEAEVAAAAEEKEAHSFEIDPSQVTQV